MTPTRHALIKPAVAQLQAYDAHKRPGQVKLDANEHPFVLPPVVRAAVLQALATVSINRYPDPEAEGLRHTGEEARRHPRHAAPGQWLG